jgi:hypothetical protein
MPKTTTALLPNLDDARNFDLNNCQHHTKNSGEHSGEHSEKNSGSEVCQQDLLVMNVI